MKKRLINFILEYYQLILRPFCRYKNRIRFKKEMAKLRNATINLIDALEKEFIPIMEKAVKDIGELIKSCRQLKLIK